MNSFRRLVWPRPFLSKLNEIPSEIHRLKFQQLRTLIVCDGKHRKFHRTNLILAKYSTGSKGNPTVKGSEKNVRKLEDIEDENDFDDEENDDYDDDDDDDDDENYENFDRDEDEEQDGSNGREMFEEIAGGDPEVLNQLKLIEFEIALMKEMGANLPAVIKQKHWVELLHLPTTTKRSQYLGYLYMLDLKCRNKKDVQIYKKEKALEKKSQSGFHYYGLTGHTMFYRVYDSSLRKLLNHRQCASKLNILYDCSYQEYMTPRGIKNCAKQLALCVSSARLHKVSCNVGFCNVDKNDALGKIFPLYLDILNNSLYKESHKSYLDLYPKEKIIYLSPHGPEDLTEVSEDFVYIIGSYIDRGLGVKASLAKAKENDVRAVRFPIDYYLAWKEGNKALTLPVVTNILLDMAFYNDWYRAFKHIPSRSHYGGVSRKKFIFLNRADKLMLK